MENEKTPLPAFLADMEKQMPKPLVILKYMDKEEYILLGLKNDGPYLVDFKLIKEKNERYYPEYKIIHKEFLKRDGLVEYENFLKSMFDPLEHEIIYDNVYFKELNI